MYGSATVAVNACTDQPSGTLAAQEWDGTCWAAGANPAQTNFRSRAACQTGTTGFLQALIQPQVPLHHQM